MNNPCTVNPRAAKITSQNASPPPPHLPMSKISTFESRDSTTQMLSLNISVLLMMIQKQFNKALKLDPSRGGG